jgi:hypothetical protein
VSTRQPRQARLSAAQLEINPMIAGSFVLRLSLSVSMIELHFEVDGDEPYVTCPCMARTLDFQLFQR